MPNIVYIAVSLDGYIAKKDGGIDWLTEIPNTDNSDFGYYDFIKRIDAIVMGRKTYELILTFKAWPYKKPVFVLSNSLSTVSKKLLGKVEIIKGEPETIVKMLSARNYINLYIDGGITIQNFLKSGLIDELIITRVPILLGEGIPLFSTIPLEQKFEHIKTEVYNNAFVKSHYKKLKYS